MIFFFQSGIDHGLIVKRRVKNVIRPQSLHNMGNTGKGQVGQQNGSGPVVPQFARFTDEVLNRCNRKGHNRDIFIFPQTGSDGGDHSQMMPERMIRHSGVGRQDIPKTTQSSRVFDSQPLFEGKKQIVKKE